jgi:XRE family transcriptional regulator, aerobic/anaerobic benzoate catabolism transcriptional regulator
MAGTSSPSEKAYQQVGERLRAARAKIGMTRKQLAALSGTSERYLAHIEAGDGNPTLSVMEALAAALDLAMADLLPVGGERSEAYARAAASVRRLPASRLTDLQNWIQQRPVAAADGRASRIVLVGLRGAGKSSLGRALGEKLQVPFFEVSKEVERAFGGEMRLLIELNGQSTLRRYEAEAWETICNEHDGAVIAAPGAIVADSALYERVLATAHSVWLEATPEDHMARVVAQGDLRPMARNPGAMQDLKAILAARSADYARAERRVNTSQQDFAKTVSILETVARELIGR